MTHPGEAFDPTPTLRRTVNISSVASADPRGSLESTDADAVGLPVGTDDELPDVLHADRTALQRSGFTGAPGQALALPRTGGPALVAVGVGARSELDSTVLRNAAAAFARAVPDDSGLAFLVPDLASRAPAAAAAAIVEGVLLARYEYSLRRHSSPRAAVSDLTLLTTAEHEAEVNDGLRRGQVLADATALCRDLANSPGSTLTASRMADVAVEVGGQTGLTVEVFDLDALVELGCGGLLGINRGSVEPPRMIRVRYTPDGEPTGRLTLVGKGIMYDSGGISLKPSDASHSAMKNDMTGAAAVLAAMTTLRSLGCRAAVTGYLMCTDNMPSGSALKLGDVVTMHGGKTVEILNTDAEGRVVMADALVLATEEPVDAIVDIATLTGAALRTLGPEVAAVLGNNQALIEQVKSAADATDEPVWQLPLEHRYRSQLDSTIADLSNMGGVNAGSITAALFLEEFVDGRPWAHIDIAGTAQADAPRGWVNQGATGSGARLLADLALNFTAPGR